MLEVIRNISTALGLISVSFGLVCSISKSVRSWFSNLLSKKEHENSQDKTIGGLCDKLDKYIASNEEFKQKITEDMEVQKDFARDQCRNAIKDIFYKYCDTKKIPLYEFKVAENTFDTYSKKLNGNHYIALLWGEIQKWEIDYTHSFEGEE